MPNLSVIIASGEQVVADMFVEADDSLQDVANATACSACRDHLAVRASVSGWLHGAHPDPFR